MMSTPLSTRPLPTSPQVTASVVKFRCLYTHDLRRKSKRWHDGNLRYHKFNKRVMVYDDQGNFIGDHHWRSLDEVQDGDEMQLDKGVLIEVGENMGTTETDITNLYEKKRSSQGSPRNKDPMSQVPRASTAASPTVPATVPAPIRCSSASSQPFRSLNDLLGIKKTPVRQFASPYEQRNPPPPVARPEPERAPKRLKTSLVHPTGERSPRPQSQVIDLTEPTAGVQSQQVSTPLARQATRIGGNSTVRPPTNHQQRPALSKPTQLQRPGPPSFSRISIPASSPPSSSLPTPENIIRPATKTAPPTKPSTDRPKDVPSVQPRRPITSSSNPILVEPTVVELPRPREKLRADEQPTVGENRPTKVQPFHQPQPQRLVPPATRSHLLTTSNSSITQPPAEKPAAAQASRPRGSLRMKEAPINLQKQRQDVPPALTSVPPIEPQRNISPVSKSDLLTTPNSSTARPVAEPAVSNNVQPAKTADKQAPNSMPPPSRPSTTKPSEPPTAALRMSIGKPRRKLMYSALLPSASRTPSSTTSNTPLGSANPGHATNTLEPETASDPAMASEPTGSEEFMPSTSTQFIFDEMLDGSRFQPSAIRALNGRRPVDSPLRKSVSDPTALVGTGIQKRARNSVNTVTIATETVEQGAWTSEALDLFDFWPAGRPKPNE